MSPSINREVGKEVISIKKIGNEQDNWSMNEGNLICVDLYFLRILFLFLTLHDLGCIHIKEYLCLRCLPDGLVKFFEKEAHCYIGWVVQSVLSKRSVNSGVWVLKMSGFQRAQGTQMEIPSPLFSLPNVRSSNQPDLLGSLKDTDCLPSLSITPGKDFYAQLINQHLNSNNSKG